MPAPYPIELRRAAVAALESGEDTVNGIADRFRVGRSTLLAWAKLFREGKGLEPAPRGGGRFSDVDVELLLTVLKQRRDATAEELTRAYNAKCARGRRASRSSITRALKREGFVFKKKRPRPAEQDRPDVRLKREGFRRWMERVDPRRVVVLDEAAANTKMGRSHAWIQRGEELVDPRPMNWGKSLTMIGAIRLTGWVCLGTLWGAATYESFSRWFVLQLLPKLSAGDFVVLDNAKAHKDVRLARVAKEHGVTIKYLPPYSPDFSPIEPAWRSSRSESKPWHPAMRTRSVESRIAPVEESAPVTAKLGSLTAAFGLESSDLRD
jgi:transposase